MPYLHNKQSKHIEDIGLAAATVLAALQKLAVPSYIFAGFALYLHGIETVVDDADIRVLHPDITEVCHFLQQEFPSYSVKISPARPYAGGMYANFCLELECGKVDIDICTDMRVECDLGIVDYPHTPTFEDSIYVPYRDTQLPVASIEFLLLYYLVLRRGEADGKVDEARIKQILKSGKLDHQKFLRLIDGLPQGTQLRALYLARLRWPGRN